MVDFLSYLAVFIFPVLIILIVNIRRRQKLMYPHLLFEGYREKNWRFFLLRRLQLLSDVIFDLLIAVVIALLLSGIIGTRSGKTAVCLDGSYSMILGPEGQTALDRGIELIREEFAGQRYDLTLLGYDAASGGGRLYPLKRLPAAGLDLAAERRFFHADPTGIGELVSRGYRRIVFVTDRSSGELPPAEVREVGFHQEDFIYPLSASWDYASSRYRIILFSRFVNSQPEISLLREGGFELLAFSPDLVPVGRELFAVYLDDPGLYRISVGGMSCAVRLPPPVIGARPEGVFSEILTESLPVVERREGQIELTLRDEEEAEILEDSRLRRSLRKNGRAGHRLLTVWRNEAVELFLHPPGLTYCHLLPALLPREDVRWAADAVIPMSRSLARYRDVPLLYHSLIAGWKVGAWETPGSLDDPGRLVHGESTFLL